MHATMNTFPPFQSMNSPRGWVLAGIVLLHAGFFWLLSSGMAKTIVDVVRGPTEYVVIDTKRPPPPPEREIHVDRILTPITLTIPAPDPIPLDPESEAPAATVVDQPTASESAAGSAGPATPTPVIVQPDVDPRIGLSEPLYPASEIRAEHTGTVLLSVWVLENGRVGDVRLEQSSGWKKLDDSALREARRWRFKPGMRDGIAAAMWKQVPVTFQLQTDGTR